MDIMLSIIKKQKGSGIVYVRSRNMTVEISKILKSNGVSSDFYHAGLAIETREKKQLDWMNNKFQVICTTNAFGMGIDKPNVRFVINLDLPDSLEAYFQEAGRGGRDGNKSFAVLLVSQADRDNLLKRTNQRFPDIDIVKRVYGLICNEFRLAIGSGELESFHTEWETIKSRCDFSLNEIVQSATILERSGYWQISEGGKTSSSLKILVSQGELYPFQIRYPKLDHVLKVLLRSHAGLFDSYVSIRETEIAKRANLNVAAVVASLRELSNIEIIDYVENQDKLNITFLRPREDIKRLRIPKEFYAKLKETAMSNANSIINYAYSDHLCRSRMLLSYFGESSKEDCGTCDYCMKRKIEKAVDNEMILTLKKEIEQILLVESELPLIVIVDKMSKHYKRDNVKFAVQWMLDNGIIMVNASSNIQLV
jgi:ATP-dependent DNA helicase RecQ